MRAAMAGAEVGDDERDGDPTTRRLEERVAALLGKQAALFFPSGCMANQAGVWVHAGRGTEVLLDVDAHIVHSEIAATAAISGAQVLPVQPRGLVMTAEDLRGAFRPASRYFPAPSLVCVENTHNGAGGVITPLRELRAIRVVASERGLPVHLDGARLWNASVASGVALDAFAAEADTVMVAFSKGLGAPVGAALAGTHEAIERAWTARKLFGGAMRQSGILAAAALYALDHHLPKLAEDHENAKAIARIVDGAGDARVVAPDTNIVMIDLAPRHRAADVAYAAKQRGVLIAEWSQTRLRMVTHLDVSAADAVAAAEIVRELLSE
jgi:threonine aldolase